MCACGCFANFRIETLVKPGRRGKAGASFEVESDGGGETQRTKTKREGKSANDKHSSSSFRDLFRMSVRVAYRAGEQQPGRLECTVVIRQRRVGHVRQTHHKK